MQEGVVICGHYASRKTINKLTYYLIYDSKVGCDSEEKLKILSNQIFFSSHVIRNSCNPSR